MVGTAEIGRGAPDTASETTSRQEPKQEPKHWIYGPSRDFWLIHAGLGLATLPVVAASFFAPTSLSPLLLVYTLLLGLPHLCATHVRLNLDQDCRARHRWLALAAPAAAMAMVATIVYTWHMLPALVLAWFLLQSWHANRQNFGIMRRYIRMSGSDSCRPVNRLAEAGVEIVPWAAITTTLLLPSKYYFGYPIAALPTAFVFPIVLVLWSLSILVATLYLGFECYEWYRGRSVPGRILCFLSGLIVNLTAWLLVKDVLWGYLTVSSWHALQYISYVHAFRASPPPGAKVLRLSAAPHMTLLLAGGFALYWFTRGLQWWVPSALVVFHLGMNLHHYLADALIWRAPKKALAK